MVKRWNKKGVTEKILLGTWAGDQMSGILHEGSRIGAMPERIRFLSDKLLGTPYRESTLIGDRDIPEVFVVDLTGLDCFTFIDYIDAMRLSTTIEEFKEQVRRARYREGRVTFRGRNHFFTDWSHFNNDRVLDITEEIGRGQAVKTLVNLNRKEDGSLFIPGIKPSRREMAYIPVSALNSSVTERLVTGDYLGIYADTPGLDVSHVGIVIQQGGRSWLRHASSLEKYRKVVDDALPAYLEGKPGVIVLRPLSAR
jgi:hypothetical protein